MPNMIDTKKTRAAWIIAALLIACVVAVIGISSASAAPSKDAAKLAKYVQKHGSELTELAAEYPNQYVDIGNRLGIKAVDTRADDVSFVFSWSYDIPEGISLLCYAPDGVLDILGYSFASDAYIDGLGINGQGYIKCTRLGENWFFAQSVVPT